MLIFTSIDPTVELIIRLFLALVFVGAVFHKLGEPRRFQDTVREYGLLPGLLVMPVAAVLIVLECLTVITLLVPVTAYVGALLAGSLLLLYTASIAINLLRGRTRIDCGCTGFVQQGGQLSGWLLARNLPLVCISFLVTLPVQPRALAAWDIAVVLCASLALGMLYSSVNHLLVNGPRLRAWTMNKGYGV
jgi:uncharacterized membrane protein YphA (DoxX/SURF4 family)